MRSAASRPKRYSRGAAASKGLLAVQEHLKPRQLSVAASLHVEDLEVHLDAAFSTATSMSRHAHG
jgi:hypothetical protein